MDMTLILETVTSLWIYTHTHSDVETGCYHVKIPPLSHLRGMLN